MKIEHHDFLVEIGTEELPPKALHTLERALVAGIGAGLDKAGLAHGELAGFATPRRLAVLVKRLAARQAEQHLRRGPPLSAAFDAQGHPTRAATPLPRAAARRSRRSSASAEGKGTFLFFVGTRAGERAVDLLPGLVQSALDALPIPRRMHWGAGSAQFVRPVHWVVMLLGDEVVPATLLDTPRRPLDLRPSLPRAEGAAPASPAPYERTLRERGKVLADFGRGASASARRSSSLATALSGRALLARRCSMR